MSILDNSEELSRRVNEVAEVAGYLWQKGWAERNGGNIVINITDCVDEEIRRLPSLGERLAIGTTLPHLQDCYFYCKGTNRRMRDLAREPMANGSVIRITDDCAHYEIIADQAVRPTSELPSHLSVHDYLIAHPFVGLSYTQPAFLDSLELKAGLLTAFDRERGIEKGSHTPLGFLGELSAVWKRLQFKETIYAGGNMQHFGNEHFGQYYWGDTYTQAPFYSRTDLNYRFISNDYVNVFGGVIVNATKYGINHHQVITLRLNLGGNK